MDKSAHRNQSKTRRAALQTPLTGIISDPEKAQELVEDAQHFAKNFAGGLRTKAIPALRKFSRENWRQIALVSAGVAIIAGGAYYYFANKKSTLAKDLN